MPTNRRPTISSDVAIGCRMNGAEIPPPMLTPWLPPGSPLGLPSGLPPWLPIGLPIGLPGRLIAPALSRSAPALSQWAPALSRWAPAVASPARVELAPRVQPDADRPRRRATVHTDLRSRSSRPATGLR